MDILFLSNPVIRSAAFQEARNYTLLEDRDICRPLCVPTEERWVTISTEVNKGPLKYALKPLYFLK